MSTKQYQTYEQYREIQDSILNGNWTQAAKECVEYGFWANDLIKAWESDEINYAMEDGLDSLKDLILLAEMAAERRCK